FCFADYVGFGKDWLQRNSSVESDIRTGTAIIRQLLVWHGWSLSGREACRDRNPNSPRSSLLTSTSRRMWNPNRRRSRPQGGVRRLYPTGENGAQRLRIPVGVKKRWRSRGLQPCQSDRRKPDKTSGHPHTAALMRRSSGLWLRDAVSRKRGAFI